MILISHTLTTPEPMSHGDPGPDLGNVTRFRRIPLVFQDEVRHVPAVSAGALRGTAKTKDRVTVQAPPLEEKDMAQGTAALAQVTSALTVAE
jgi:hypothetical protein